MDNLNHEDWCRSLNNFLLSNPPKNAPCNCGAKQIIAPSIPGWKPIETAPRDNSRLLYLARFVDGRLVELDFDGVWEYWEESWEMSHINGWTWVSNNGIEEPTHWAYQDEPIPLT